MSSGQKEREAQHKWSTPSGLTEQHVYLHVIEMECRKSATKGKSIQSDLLTSTLPFDACLLGEHAHVRIPSVASGFVGTCT